MFDQYCLGVDLSHWQAAINWEPLLRAGVRFAIMKASQGSYGRDPSTATHVRNARQGGLICGIYHWFDPGCSAESQLTNLKMAVAELDFDFLALDVEQYWQNWDDNQRNKPENHFSSQHISRRSLEMAQLMRQTWRKPVVVYTRASFVREFAPDMSHWLGQFPLWMAHYPYPTGRVSLSWETLKQHYAPTIRNPLLPAGCPTWKFWQFSGDKFILPGLNVPLDLDFFQGSLQDLQDWLGQARSLPAWTIDEKITLLWQAHPQLWQSKEESNEKETQTHKT